MKQLGIDYETADMITRLNLTDARDSMKKELKQFYDTMGIENPTWMHPEDIGINMQTIAALDLIISHFIETEDTIK